jgi:hypothetical protein
MQKRSPLPQGFVYREIGQLHLAGYFLMKGTLGEKVTYHGMTNLNTAGNSSDFLFSGLEDDLNRIESEFQSSESRLFDDNVRSLKMQLRDALRRG